MADGQPTPSRVGLIRRETNLVTELRGYRITWLEEQLDCGAPKGESVGPAVANGPTWFPSRRFESLQSRLPSISSRDIA